MSRNGEEGTALVTVLAVIALTSAVLVTMVTTQTNSITRSQRYSEAAQAVEIARGAEASAIAALRRDGRDAPEIDHAGEAWAALGEQDRPIEGGTFSLEIEDAQARLNLTSPPGSNILFRAVMQRILQRAIPEIDFDAVAKTDPALIEGLLSEGLPIDPSMTAQITPYVTRLPVPTDVNINSADEALLAILVQNAVAARRIVGLRGRKGFITMADVRALGILLPRGLGVRSKFFIVRATVRIGSTTQRLESLLHRRKRNGRVVVEVVSRRRGFALP